MNDQEIPSNALIDCRGMGIAFMDQDFARQHQIPLQVLKEKIAVKVIDGRPIESGDITHVAKIGMKVHHHQEQRPRFVTKLGQYLIVLGIPWLGLHHVAVQFASNTVSCVSQHCTTHCNNKPVTVQGVTDESPEPVNQRKDGVLQP